MGSLGGQWENSSSSVLISICAGSRVVFVYLRIGIFQWHILCLFPLVEYFHNGIDGAGKFGRAVREFLGREILCCGARETRKRWRSRSASICRGPIRSEGGPAARS